MQTSILNSRLINTTLFTDESDNVPVAINYDYYKISDTFGAFGIVVVGIDYKLNGTTATPKEVIIDQVEEEIKANHYGLSIDFEL